MTHFWMITVYRLCYFAVTTNSPSQRGSRADLWVTTPPVHYRLSLGLFSFLTANNPIILVPVWHWSFLVATPVQPVAQILISLCLKLNQPGIKWEPEREDKPTDRVTLFIQQLNTFLSLERVFVFISIISLALQLPKELLCHQLVS